MPGGNKTEFELAIIKKIVQLRKANGLSQKDLAKKLELTRGFIGQVESNNNPSVYSLNHLNRLAYVLNCSVHDFIPTQPIVENNWNITGSAKQEKPS